MQLVFSAPRASENDHARGLEAAHRFLQRAEVTPDIAKAGADMRNAWGKSGLAPLIQPSDKELAAADAWDGALEAAISACYRGSKAPLNATLLLVPDDGHDEAASRAAAPPSQAKAGLKGPDPAPRPPRALGGPRSGFLRRTPRTTALRRPTGPPDAS